MSRTDPSAGTSSRWTSQLIVKIAIVAAAAGCLGPLTFALVRSGTHTTPKSSRVQAVGQVSLNSSPAASSVQAPSAQGASRPASVASNVPGATTTSVTALLSAVTTTSTTLAAQSQVAVVTVVDADDGKTIVLRKGQRLRVMLDGPTWQFAEPSDPDVLTPQGQATYAPGDNCTPLPGTHCGKVTAEFSAMKTGTSVVTATRTPCNEGFQCPDEQAQYRLEVRVRT